MAVWILGIPDLEKTMAPEDVKKYKRFVDDIAYLTHYLNDIRICLIILTITLHLVLIVYVVSKCFKTGKRKPHPRPVYTPPPMTRSRSQSDYQMDKPSFQITPDRPPMSMPETRIQMTASCYDFSQLSSKSDLNANMHTLDTIMANPAYYRRRPSSMRRKSFIGNHVGHMQHQSHDGSDIQLDVPTITTSLGSEP